MNMAITNIIFLIFFLVWKAESSHWSYKPPHGPSTWYRDYPKCNGYSQSPININNEEVSYRQMRLTFDYKPRSQVYVMKNNGHSLQVDVLAGDMSVIVGGKGKYVLDQFHFHWGPENRPGSEHTIDGVQYPAELHFVHHKKIYGSLTNALKYEDGLAVVAVMIQIGDHNSVLEEILADTTLIDDVGESVSKTSFDLSEIVKGAGDGFYRYKGSLTTPPCSEVVIWNILSTPITLSAQQLENLRQLEDSEGEELVNNFRPIQQLNHRIVYKTV